MATILCDALVGRHNIDPNVAFCAKALDESLRGLSHNFLWGYRFNIHANKKQLYNELALVESNVRRR